MWKALINLIEKWGCHHEWKLVKEVHIGLFHYRFIYICNKCGEIKRINIDD